MTPNFSLEAYLAKVGLDAASVRDYNFLDLLPAHHAAAVPFGNIEVLAGRTPDTSADGVFSKLIVRGQPGYCHEHAPLVRSVLRTAGFDTRAVLGRILIGDPQEAKPFTHQANLVVQGEDRRIVDPGFGTGSPLRSVPLPLDGHDMGEIVSSANGDHRIVAARATDFRNIPRLDYIMEFRPKSAPKDEEEFSAAYGFSIDPVAQSDLDVSNWWSSTHPDFIFKNVLAAARHRLDGTKVTVSNTTFRVSPQDSEATERELHTPEELREVLRDELNASVSVEDAEATWKVITS